MIPVALALLLQPDDAALPPSPIGEGEIAILITIVVVVTGVFTFDMARTWWTTTRWRRDARRKRRDLL